jgi:hypothetical protein
MSRKIDNLRMETEHNERKIKMHEQTISELNKKNAQLNRDMRDIKDEKERIND